MKKARIIVTEKCNRNCEGCYNKDWKYEPPIELEDFNILEEYDEIIITGGEPLLYPTQLQTFLSTLWKKDTLSEKKFYLYSADCTKILELIDIITLLDGLTFTIHSEEDIKPFLQFNRILLFLKEEMLEDISLRLYIFDNLQTKFPLIDLSLWKVKNVSWIKDCPLPEEETLFILKHPLNA